MTDSRYIAVPPGAIIPGALPDFRIYVVTPQGKHVLWALEGKKVTTEQLAKLSESGTIEVFIALEEQFKYELYLESNLGNILGNQSMADDHKAEVFSKVSTNVLKVAFETSYGLGTMGTAAIQRTQQFIENALIFIKEAKSLQALAKMIGHDYRTYEHSTKVLWFTVAFLQLNPYIMEQIEPGYQLLDETRRMDMMKQCGIGALLHDIGKAFVSQDILTKNEPLNEVEWEIMKRHPLNGMAMLIDTEIPTFVKKAVLHHHEDFEGGGYPMSLEGQNINILARVLRIIDVFDAMTSRRSYKDPMPPMKAAQIMIGMPEDKEEDEDPKQDDRDMGMRRCFDRDLLKKFIVFLGNVKLNE
ncbi:MAG: HD domain-containing protein [Desulfobacterales bacterium]|nr:HD domain-containing protein [Desulfobacterales bacterium]